MVLTAAVAVVDWVAVASDRRRLEYLAKPATLVLLIGVALSLEVAHPRCAPTVVVALVLSLVGDVLLMLPGAHWFVFGLGAFLVAHLAYVVAFWLDGVSGARSRSAWSWWRWPWPRWGGASSGRAPAAPSASCSDPVAGYIAVISVMVASAIGTRQALVVAGAAALLRVRRRSSPGPGSSAIIATAGWP